jgi:hypothetical protein
MRSYERLGIQPGSGRSDGFNTYKYFQEQWKGVEVGKWMEAEVDPVQVHVLCTT